MMKIKGVLDGFSSKVTPAAKPEEEIAETLRSDNFQIAKTFLYGFPYQPTALAFDPVQRLLAIGTKTGSLRILGRPGVDTQVRHENEVAVIQIDFLMNEGALITATSDDSLHLWNFRQKRPEIVHSLKFQKERITYMNLPVGSKWLYVGTERGNVHVINVESFTLSGYIINWNKAIDVLRPTHPGPVVHLSDCPTDANKLLIGYESGQIVLWNLRTKKADIRWQSSESLKSISWHFEGKQFICAHSDGSLTTWALRPQEKPTSTIAPHSKLNKEGKVDPPCKAIQKVEWKISKAGDTYIIFSGGTSYESAGRNPNITIMYKKAVTVVEMEHNIVDFITLCESPYVTEMQDPYAIVVLLQNDLVVLDLNTPEFPCFENPYPMDIHESPVTYCSYIADCPSDIIPAFYSVGSRATQKRAHYYSTKEWPISGGEPSPTSCCSYNEIIITGHNDGSVKFWDASAGNLQILYKLKTAKVFEKQKSRSTDGNEDDPFSVQLISLCPESRKLAVAGASGYVIMFKFRKLESTSDIPVIKIPSNSGYADQEPELSPDYDSASRRSEGSQRSSVLEYSYPVRVKSGPQKKPPGFQPHLVCLTAFSLPSEPMFQITALAINSSYGLLAYGSENGVVIVDFIRKCCLWNVSSCDLYGNSDPFQRSVRSPKRNTASAEASDGERCRSPSIDQDVETEENGRKHTLDKLDSTFSRSRSSSMSSLENITSEAIQCLVFADSFNKKSDSVTTPMLWIGTSVGSVFNVLANIPPSGESRLNQPATISAVCMLDGPVVRLKGGILTISFLDYNGSLIRYAYEQWKDETRDKRTPTKGTNNPTNSSLNSSVESVNNANSANQNCDKQYMVVVSEKQARVIALPSHDCIFKQQLADTDFVVKAQVILYQDSVCLLCYLSNSHITAYGLPSLRPLIDVEFLPLSDLRISKTFCFSSRGHGLYFASPSEIQKFTISAKFCEEMSEMVSELFVARDMPEAPKQSLFKSLLAGVPRSVDREELFGESSGKPAGSVAKHIPGPSTQVEQLSLRANTAAGEVSKAHHLMVERGEKLGQLEERTQRMMSESEKFASSAHDLLQKTKEKKWYQL